MNLTSDDKSALLLIVSLTAAAFLLIIALPVVSTYQIRTQDVVMVVGWLIGATMTWAYVRWQRLQ